MSEDETATYIHARLDRAIAPTALVERFDPEVVAQLHVDSAGIPREIHRLVGALFRDGADAVAAPAPTPELREAHAGSEPQAPPPPTGPSEAVASEPEPEPIPETAPVPWRLASRGRLLVFGFLVAAVLLAAVPLLRGGLPWKPATQGDDPAATPPAAVPPREMPAPLAPEASGELIAVNVNATPWASIEVDGRYLGMTPLAGVLLPPGLHVFRARMPDGEIREHRVEVGATMRHVVFYAEVSPEEIEPAPETAAALAPPPPVPQELPEVAVEPSKPLEKEVPETAVAPERVAPAREPEPAPPPPALEPEVAAAIAPPPPVPEERPEITVGSSQPSEEEVPEVAVAPEQVASARETELPASCPAADLRIHQRDALGHHRDRRRGDRRHPHGRGAARSGGPLVPGTNAGRKGPRRDRPDRPGQPPYRLRAVGRRAEPDRAKRRPVRRRQNLPQGLPNARVGP